MILREYTFSLDNSLMVGDVVNLIKHQHEFQISSSHNLSLKMVLFRKGVQT